jgi:hypothetical protein
MIVCYVLSIAALNLGLGFVAAAYLRQRHEEMADVPLSLDVAVLPRQAGGALREGPSRPAP